tara:strand:- start:414 stop:1688 length:1275 start_codon:yes stop_codon:yes gene_type:complete
MHKYCLLNHSGHINSFQDAHGWGTESYINACRQHVDSLIALDPDAFLIVDGAEMDLFHMFSHCIDHLKTWCTEHNKKIHIFTAGWPAGYPKLDYVQHHVYQGYDHLIYHHNNLYFSENKSQTCHDGTWFTPTRTPDLLYTCYNNQLRDYRHYAIDQLAKHNLLDKGVVTARLSTVVAPTQPNSYWPFKYIPSGTKLVDEEDFELHMQNPEGGTWTPNSFPRSFGRGTLDIVTESRIGHDEFYLSEKTNKSLLAHKPFIVVSSPNYHKWLKEVRNIEPYDEIFDYSFDSIEDDEKRIDGVAENIKRLSEEYKTPEDYQRLYTSVREKTIHNYQEHMKLIRSGDTMRSLFDFLGLGNRNSIQSQYHRDERHKWFYNSIDGDNVDHAFNFYYKVVKNLEPNDRYLQREADRMSIYMQKFPNSKSLDK